jgi:hypothetical protein
MSGIGVMTWLVAFFTLATFIGAVVFAVRVYRWMGSTIRVNEARLQDLRRGSSGHTDFK